MDGEGEGGLRLTLLDKFITKNSQPPSCIVKFLQILCSSCIHLILVILWLVVFDKDILSGGRGESIRSYIFFPKITFNYFTTIKIINTLVYQSLNSYFFFCFLKYESFSNCQPAIIL